ncbi:hypothetical protein KGQ29_02720 [Patescibacteria group bacterium]|nr:hypothetical protein [Patescibacteria group bacterium]
MNSKGFASVIPIIILAVIAAVGTGTAIYFRSPTEKILPPSDGVFDKRAENLDSVGEQSKDTSVSEVRPPAGQEELFQLEQQLKNALKSGGISPETYKVIDGQLKELEKNGIDTSAARPILSKLEIGGAKKEVSKNTPLISSGQSSRQSSAQIEFKLANQSPISQHPECASNPRPTFAKRLIDPSLVTNILPPPNRPKTDLTVLKTHSYINTQSMNAPIYAPVDMELIKGAHYVGGPYSLDFRVSCEVMLRLAHITNPAPKIKAAFPAEPQNGSTDNQVNPPIAFKAGELVGYSGGPPYTPAIGFDFGVYNSSTPNRFAAEPDKYTSSIYTTAVCPFDYFTPAVRDEYKAIFYLQTREGMQYDLPHFCQ